MSRTARKPRDSESARQIPSMDKSIVDFKNAPVNEVVCGIAFRELENYSTPQMGLFWSAVRNEFPVAEIMPPLTPPGPEPKLHLSVVPPAPRYFLRSADRSELIQLQENRFLYNWLRTENKPVYPHYKHVIRRFNKLKRTFKNFLDKHDLGSISVRELRLTYVNHILQGEGWDTPADIAKVFPNFRFKRRGCRYLNSPIGWNFVTHFPVQHENSLLEVTVRTGSKDPGNGTEQPLFILQLTVIGNVVDPSQTEMQAWFNMAREAIDLSFLDLTDAKVQKEIWGIHEHR